MLNEQLRRLREKNGYTQQNVADYLNIQRSTYSYYEIGKTRPDIETLKKLSNLYHVSIDYIAGNDTKMKSADPVYKLPADDANAEMDLSEKEIVSLLRKIPESDRARIGRMIVHILKSELSDQD